MMFMFGVLFFFQNIGFLKEKKITLCLELRVP